MGVFQHLLGEQVTVLMSGNTMFNGILIDTGTDIIVLYNGEQYIYIPLLHIHSIRVNKESNNYVSQPTGSSLVEEMDAISYRKTLTYAKGTFVEIYVTGNLTFHGYITNVLNDYFAFYSPVFKQMFITLSHLKWLSPYHKNITPYDLSQEKLPVSPSTTPLLRSLEDQLEREKGRLVVLDGGSNPLKIGILSDIEQHMIELIIADGDRIHLNLNHIKSIYFA